MTNSARAASSAADTDPETTLITPDAPATQEHSRRRALILRSAGPVLLLAIWWILSATGVLTDDLLAAPPTVAHSAWELWQSGQLSDALVVSLGRAGAGLALGVATGLALGLLAGTWRIGKDVLDSAMQTLRALPFLSLVPLFMVWFGIGESARIVLIAVATTFPMYVSTSGGVQNTDRKLLESARVFGMRPWTVIRKIVLPGALPSLFSGLRLSTTLSVIALIAAEEINVTAGLGYLMSQAQNFSRTDILTVVIIIYGLIGLIADVVIRGIERLMMPWLRAGGAR
ncbi:MAG: ABC transporter permease [Gordonia sp. (in: high G+C Gram-positive bacteria)]